MGVRLSSSQLRGVGQGTRAHKTAGVRAYRTYRTSVFPLSLYRNESSIGERTLYKTLLLIRIFRKTVRQEQIQDTKSTRKRTSVFTTELNERVHESKQCIPSLFTYIELKVPSGSFFGKIVFASRTTRANPVLKSSISNWRLSRQCFRTELWTERACLSYSRIQCSKHKSDLFCHRIKRVVFINQTSVFTFTLTLPIILNWKFDRAAIHSNTPDIQGLRDERYLPVNAFTIIFSR